MSERNEKMTAMLAADGPAVRDLVFQLGVMAKIEQRRFRRGVVFHVVLAAALTLTLALVMPAIDPVLQQAMTGIGSSLAAAMLIAASVVVPWWATRRA